MKESKLKKEIAAWKIMMDSRNSKEINTLLFFAFICNTICFLIVCLKRLCQNQNDFPGTSIVASLSMMVLCYSIYCRMFYNRTALCFVKTLPCSKSIYTRKLPFLFECINTFFMLIVFSGIFFCLSRGYNSRYYYVVIIFFLILHFCLSVLLPFTVRVFNSENRIYYYNFNTRFPLHTVGGWCLYILQILPLLLISFFAKPLAELFEPLSLPGLTMMAGVAGAVVVVSCTANYFMFRMAYKRR